MTCQGAIGFGFIAGIICLFGLARTLVRSVGYGVRRRERYKLCTLGHHQWEASAEGPRCSFCAIPKKSFIANGGKDV